MKTYQEFDIWIELCTQNILPNFTNFYMNFKSQNSPTGMAIADNPGNKIPYI